MIYFLFISVSIFYSTVYAHSCRDLIFVNFTPAQTQTETPVTRTTLKIRGSRSADQYSNGIYRSPELLAELVKNKKYPMLSYIESRTGNTVRWFLSLSNNGRIYRVVAKIKSTGGRPDFYAEIPSLESEHSYYSQVARQLEIQPLTDNLQFPQRGRRGLIIPPNILVKLDLKHNIVGEDLVKLLQSSTRYIRTYPNSNPNFLGKDSFKIFINVPGHISPLQVVFLVENNQYLIITAFFPEIDANR